MQENLVIVESPAKVKTIEKFLGKDYKVMSSYGHIRDLKKKEISIDLDTTSFGRGQIILRLENGTLVRGTESRTDSHIACY